MKKRNEQLLDALSDVGMDLVEESEIRSSFGNGWRRFGSLAACLVLVAGITAAGVHFLPKLVNTQPDPNPTLSDTPSPEPSPEVHTPTPPISGPDDGPGIPEDPADVRFLYSEQGSYTDGVDNYSAYFWQVPQLNFNSPDAIAINKAIADRFGSVVEAEKKAMEDQLSLNAPYVGCTIFYNYDGEDEIITLLCVSETSWDYTDYAAYHYHTGRGEELGNGELLELLGFDTDEYLAALKQAAASRYLFNTMLWGNFAPGQTPEDDFRWEQYRKTVSGENINLFDVPMYVTQGNEGLIVRAFPNIYSIAGADYYPEEVAVMGEKPQWEDISADHGPILDYRTALSDAWGDGMEMTLYWTDPENPNVSGPYETVTLTWGWYYGRFCALMDSYTWTEYDGRCPEPGNFWLNLSGDGLNWTFWDDGDAGYLMIYDKEGNPQCWKANHIRYTNIYDTMPIDEELSYNPYEGFTIADDLRFEYDGAAIDYENLALELSGSSAEEIAAQVADAYGRHLCSQAPGSNYGATEYAVVSTEVRAVADPVKNSIDKAILFDMTLALKPEMDGYRSALWAGNSAEGTGEWEDWMMFYREVIVQQEHGLWRITEMGTGGVMLPEE